MHPSNFLGRLIYKLLCSSVCRRSLLLHLTERGLADWGADLDIDHTGTTVTRFHFELAPKR